MEGIELTMDFSHMIKYAKEKRERTKFLRKYMKNRNFKAKKSGSSPWYQRTL